LDVIKLSHEFHKLWLLPIGSWHDEIRRRTCCKNVIYRTCAVGGNQFAVTRRRADRIHEPGHVRADLNAPAGGGNASYGQIFSVQPFGNRLVVKSFTGAQLRALLEQQFNSGSNTTTNPRVLLPSAGFTYSYDVTQAAGSRISDMRLNGIPIADTTFYRVTMNSFLATGGDNFTVFNQGSDALGGELDIDAFEAYLHANTPIGAPPTNRITRIN
jgi:5'-nucleotidase